jgi:hypothetical protein
VRARDEAALAAFTAARAGELLHTVVCSPAIRGQAEDLLQTTRVKAYRRWSRIEGENPYPHVLRPGDQRSGYCHRLPDGPAGTALLDGVVVRAPGGHRGRRGAGRAPPVTPAEPASVVAVRQPAADARARARWSAALRPPVQEGRHRREHRAQEELSGPHADPVTGEPGRRRHQQDDGHAGHEEGDEALAPVSGG